MPLNCRPPAGLALAFAISFAIAVSTAAPLRAAPQTVETVYVASVRAVDGPGSLATLNAGALHFSTAEVTIPGSHRPGGLSVEMTVEPAVSFAGKAEFTQALVAHGTREVVVLVHGFNTGFDESVRRAGQIGADFDVPASMVLFSWPSGNRLDGYEKDLARAAEARDDLKDLLQTLARSGVSRIVMIAHSLGATLAMDTLAEMRTEGASQVFAKLGGVALMSPDMPIEDFRAAMKRLGNASDKVVAYLSKGDWALQLVADVTDKRPRLGSLADPEVLADIDMTVVDVSAVPGSDLTGHYAVGGQAGLVAAINRMEKPDFIGFARMVEAGGLAGANVERHSPLVYITLPKLTQ